MPDTAPSQTETLRPDRRLAAIMASDIVGYSRRMQADEAATLAALGNLRDLTATQIERHQGRIANTAGDSIMAEFPSAVDAVSCAILQEVLAQHSADSAELQTRIGVSMGDVIYRNGDVFGTAVNIAARLETLAQPGGIAISGAVRDDIAGKLPVAFSDLGLRESQEHRRADPRFFARPADRRITRRHRECRPAYPAVAGGALVDRRSAFSQHEQ